MKTNRYTRVVHLVDQTGDASRRKVGRPTRHALADETDVSAVLVGGMSDSDFFEHVVAVHVGARLFWLNFWHVFGEELVALEEEVGSLAAEQKASFCKFDERQADQLAHVHSWNHLLGTKKGERIRFTGQLCLMKLLTVAFPCWCWTRQSRDHTRSERSQVHRCLRRRPILCWSKPLPCRCRGRRTSHSLPLSRRSRRCCQFLWMTGEKIARISCPNMSIKRRVVPNLSVNRFFE